MWRKNIHLSKLVKRLMYVVLKEKEEKTKEEIREMRKKTKF